MKYRQIAKVIMHNMLRDRTIYPEDGTTYNDGKDFTPKQTEKLQEALDAETKRLKKKLKTQGVKV